MRAEPGRTLELVASLAGGDVAVVEVDCRSSDGADGTTAVVLLQQLNLPTVVVLDSVSIRPSTDERASLASLCDLAAAVVVTSTAARDRLLAACAVDLDRVMTIRRAGWLASPTTADRGGPRTGHLRLVTWGPLGPAKGIEHVVRAIGLVDDLRPKVHYSVAGSTEPGEFARAGDRYRLSVMRSAWATGVAGVVHFDDADRDMATLLRFVRSTSVAVLPYDADDHDTPGMLVDALAAGLPVIATAFPDAVELLADGAGLVVPHRNPAALAAAIRRVACEPGLLESMAAHAREIAPSLGWPTVGAQYRSLSQQLAEATAAVAFAVGANGLQPP